MTRSRDVANIDTILTTKGDIYAASAAYTPTRLAVGNNGETLVADSSQTTGLRYNPPVGSVANPIINGGMDIWQRGTSIAITGSTTGYSADRWQAGGGSNAITVSRQTTSDTTNLPNVQYSARVQRNSGQTATTNLAYVQSLETVNTIPFAGKAVTLSFYAKKGANYSDATSALTAYIVTGTGTDQNRLSGSYTGDNTSIAAGVTLTTSWQRFVVTGTIPSTATEMAVYLTYTPTGTAGANDWFEVTGVQIDVGTYTASSAPTFRRSGGTLAGELAACQRYYVRLGGAGTYDVVAQGIAQSTTVVGFNTRVPVTMRVNPTSIESSTLAAYDKVNIIGSPTAITLLSNEGGKDYPGFSFTAPSASLTQFRPYLCVTNNSTSGYIAFNAEL